MPRIRRGDSTGHTPALASLATASLVLWLAAGPPARAQSAATQPDASTPATLPQTAPSPAPVRIDDPYEAYAAGLYDRSL